MPPHSDRQRFLSLRNLQLCPRRRVPLAAQLGLLVRQNLSRPRPIGPLLRRGPTYLLGQQPRKVHRTGRYRPDIRTGNPLPHRQVQRIYHDRPPYRLRYSTRRALRTVRVQGTALLRILCRQVSPKRLDSPRRQCVQDTTRKAHGLQQHHQRPLLYRGIAQRQAVPCRRTSCGSERTSSGQFPRIRRSRLSGKSTGHGTASPINARIQCDNPHKTNACPMT